MIVVRVKNRDITAAPLGPVTAGSVGLPVKWYFGPEWDGLAKIAVFRVGSSTGQEIAVLNDVCVVPHELLAQANAGENLFIGVYGRSPSLDAQGNYTLVMPTVWTYVRISEAPDPHDVDPEPTPGWEAQIQAAADEAVRLAGEAYAAAAPAKSYSEKAEAWAVGTINGEDVPSTDPTYHNNSMWYEQAAQRSAHNAYTHSTVAYTYASQAGEAASAAAAAAASISAALPDGGSVSADGRLYIRHGATELFSVQLPLYGGETA